MRKGYTVYQRKGKGSWYVAWADAARKRRVQKAGASRAVASEVGRAKAAEVDRVRGGVIDAGVARTVQAGRQPLKHHIDAWAKALKNKGTTLKHVGHCKSRVTKLLAGTGTLAGISAAGITESLAGLSSPQNARHYLTALRMFIRWCSDTDRLTSNPIKAVKMPAVAGEAFTRRPFTDTELTALLIATESREGTRCEISGLDRAMYYRLMAYTGLRLSEARTLTTESFNLTADPPTLIVEACYSKHRRRDTVLLRSDLADMLERWLATKLPGSAVFPFPKHSSLHRIFRLDAKAAGIVASGKSERVGIHSLRRFFITRAVRAGGLAVAQDLARHSTPSLTKKYADLTVTDHLKGLAALPACSAPDSASMRTETGKRRKRGVLC